VMDVAFRVVFLAVLGLWVYAVVVTVEALS
jgi:hypothetical protein